MRRIVFAFVLFLATASLAAHEPARIFAAAGNHRVLLPLVNRDPTPTNNLLVSAATYLGGSGADVANAIDVALDGTIVWGGTLENAAPAGVAPTVLLGGGSGAIVRLDASGRSITSLTRIGTGVSDLEISANGAIVVCGDGGIATLNATATSVVWSEPGVKYTRCAIGSDGTVAALPSTTPGIKVWDATGRVQGTWSSTSPRADIAVDSRTQTIIATGYTQKASNLQVAWLRGWPYTGGTPKWNSYDFSAADAFARNLGADTRGERVAIGRDGNLYFAGSINGGTGASIFARDPKNIAATLGADRNVATDQYNTATNVGSVKMTWYGRYDPATGNLAQGSSLLTRLSSGKGNSISARAITADEAGRVYVAGDAACCIQNRNARQIGGTTVGPYEIGEAFLLVVSPDLRQRLVWTPFTGGASAGGSPATGVAVRNGTAALTINLTKGALITNNAFQPGPSTLPDAYIAVWRP